MSDILFGFLLGVYTSTIIWNVIYQIVLSITIKSYKDYIKAWESYKESSEKLIKALKEKLGLPM